MTKIIGIDLGTTNCTLAYTSSDNSAGIEQFAIPQATKNGLNEQLMLPSFLYFPLPEEKKITSPCVGQFARERGSEVPHRLISSAKSWLCHAGINRREKILPNSSEECKLSPIEAISEILRHLKDAWNEKFLDEPFEKQQIFITVPASFDPGARDLVIEAAKKVNYPEIVLIEEPQAAFYAWLDKHKDEWRKLLKVGDQVLVVDIGGGTSDFSIIEVSEENGSLLLTRKAVGAHLLLGGDNFDLSLAYYAKQKYEEAGHQLDDWQFNFLIHACRKAKEQFLSDNAPNQIELVIQGRGSRLIGNSLKSVLTLEEVVQIILEGFAPMTNPDEHAKPEKQIGLQQIGLPFVKDPRISCQLARFLSLSENGSMENFTLPGYVLFNGGTLKAQKLKERLLNLLNQWAKILSKQAVKELPNADLDFAVSRGAAAYGLARSGHSVRIKSGTSRSYFIGVEESMPAVPGIPVPLKAYCIAPFGMEEGSEVELEKQQFSLLLGEQATFRFFSLATKTLSNGQEPVAGTVVKNWKQELTELHPIETFLSQNNSPHNFVQVRLKSKVTELGTLELYCVADEQSSWKLEFDTRGQPTK